MKMLLFVISFLCMSNIMESQTIGRGLTGEMMVNTEGGNKFEISFYNNKGVDIISLNDWYYDLTKEGIHFSSIGNNINTLKTELRTLQSKYKQWIETAKSNGVKEVEKEMPCEISFMTYSCDAFAGNATNVIIKPYFVVRNYIPHCEVRIWQYFYDRSPNYNEWRFAPNDIPFLISAIEKGYQEYLTNSSNKKRTEDLFK